MKQDNDKRRAVSGKPQLNRRINASLVFGKIREQEPISRADLVKKTGIRFTSISSIVQQLLDQRLVREVGRGKSTGGRHPILLEVNAAGLYAVGMEVGEDELRGVVVNLKGAVMATEFTTLADTAVETVVREGKALLDRLAQSAGVDRSQLSAVGLAIPGVISRDQHTVVLAQPLGWQNVPLKSLLEDEWGTEIYVLNNALAGAMNEAFDGKGKGATSLLYVLVYLSHVRDQGFTSLGCGIVLDGRAYVGAGHMAGEVRVDIEHPVAGARRILDRDVGHIEDLIKLSGEQPDACAPVWDEFAAALGRVVAWGVDFLNPGAVIVGTDVPGIEPLLQKRIQDVLEAKTVAGFVREMSGTPVQTDGHVMISVLEEGTLARGAIVPLLQELSLAPLLHESVLR
jgi:predicted NBD/HSP70 family sugar kinase